MIVGLNLDKYVILASDKREVSMSDGQITSINSDKVNKLVKWNGGIITGCGYVSLLSDLKQYLKKTDINHTDQITELAKRSVKNLVSLERVWLNQTHWMFTYITGFERGNECRLGFIKSQRPDEIHLVRSMNSLIWAKLPDLSQRVARLNNSLKPLLVANELNENLRYHLGLVEELFSYAHTVDRSVSSKFDYYIQFPSGEDFLSSDLD